MAATERSKIARIPIDDTVPLVCSIDTAHNVDNHVEYNIRIHRGTASQESWTLSRRYNDFCDLEAGLKISGLPIPLPPKKLIGNTDREFIQERRQKLQVMLNYILNHPLLANNVLTKKFLDVVNYSVNFQELALQHISMFIRSEPGWEVVEPLAEIGTRLRKYYTIIKRTAEPSQNKDKFVMSWASMGPYAGLSTKDCLAMMRLLPAFQHPNVFPTELGFSNENGGLVVRKFYESGTLRDIICKAKPRLHYLRKYGNPKSFATFNINDIRLLGRQILELLKYLSEKGIPYGQLHAGNVVLYSGNVCKILDLENFVLGQPSYYRGFATQLKKIQTTEAIDLYGFGHILYEMSCGQDLLTPTCDTLPQCCPMDLGAVILSLLGTQPCTKTGLPSVDDLLANPFFSSTPSLPVIEKPQMKVPSKLKEALKVAKQWQESCLIEEQKAISQLHRRSKIKAHHMSQEEKNKRRQSQKKAASMDEDLDGDVQLPRSGTSMPTSASSSSLTTVAASAAPAAAAAIIPAPPPPPAATVAAARAPAAAAAAGGPAPAAPPPPPPLGQGMSKVASQSSLPPVAAAVSSERGAMLNSIAAFNKAALRKSVTVDKSGPKI